MMLRFMTNLLEKKGHQVLTAEDGLSALEILNTYVPDLLFIDLVMPNINGKKLCRIIRSMPEMKDARLIIVSAIATEEEMDFADFGIDACIAKGPFNKIGQNVLSTIDLLEKGASNELSGKVIGLEDVHEHEITKELLSDKRHFEVIFHNMVEGILELTPDGKIVYANPAGISIVGVCEEELLGLSFDELFSESHCEMIESLFNSSGKFPQTTCEEPIVSLNDKQVSLNILQVKEAEHKSNIVILNDISERKLMEDKLRQAQKTEAISSLAGGIAHEFNNALSGVIGNVELLQMDLPGGGDIEDCIKSIQNSTKRMVNLTKQLLAYARGGKYQVKSMSMNDFLRDTLPLIMHTVDSSVRFETDLPADISKIEADFTQLQMVLSAVLSNASEAIEGGGHIQISVKNVKVDDDFIKTNPELKKGSYVCLAVKDDGKGMEQETVRKIFEPFYSTKFLGRGLGMAAAYGIVRNHGGLVVIDSELGKGTNVSIYLPAVDAEFPATKEPETGFTTGTVLIIEDEDVVMDVSRAMLEKLGYRTLEAKTGEKAITIAKNSDEDIDVALLDIKLPDMGGHKIYPLIKEACPNIKTIVCSGYALDGPAQEILDAGADDFIQKPYSVASLSEKIQKVLK